MARASKKSDPEVRKEKILAEARRLFLERGVGRTRMSDVAGAVGIHQALLRYYYPDVDALFVEVTREVLDGFIEFHTREIRKRAKTPLHTLEIYFRSHFEWSRRMGADGALVIYFYYLSTLPGPFRDTQAASRIGGRERISSLIFRAIESGELVPSAHRPKVDDLAHRLQTLIVGGVLKALTEPGQDLGEEADRLWDTALAVLGPIRDRRA